jgi:hypothetical protein
MENAIFTKSIAILLVVFGSAFIVLAQTVNKDACRDWKNMEYSMFTPEYHIYYGCGYYASQDFASAAREFEAGVKSFPDNAALAYHLGSAYAAFATMNTNAGMRASLLGKARAAFEKAVTSTQSEKQSECGYGARG